MKILSDACDLSLLPLGVGRTTVRRKCSAFDTLNYWSCTANYKHDVAYSEKNKRIRDVKREPVQLGPEVGCRIIKISVRLCCPS